MLARAICSTAAVVVAVVVVEKTLMILSKSADILIYNTQPL